MGYRLRRLLVVLAALALTLFPGLVFAQAAPVPISISPVSASTGGGLNTMVTFDARHLSGAANAGYYTRPVLVQPSTVGALAQGLARRATPVLALMLAIEAAGWAIDELTGQVMMPGQEQAPLEGQVWCFDWSTVGGTGYRCAATPAAAAPASLPDGSTFTGTVNNGLDPTSKQLVYQHPANYTYLMPVLLLSFPPTGAENGNPGSPPQPVPLPALAEMVAQNPALWNEVLRNPDGSVNRNPDVMAAAEQLALELVDPGPAPDPTSGWDTGHQGGPAPFPGFCTWAVALCDWLEWTQTPIAPPDDQQPEDDFGIERVNPLEDVESWNSGLGNGSCPAPRDVATPFGSITFPFDIFCQLAGLLRGLVLAAAYLTAAYILLGIRRG